jgi:sec-independent protein translocase protein TatC
VAFGISYQLPLLMWGLTISGFVRQKFWRNNLRYVIIILAIFGAIVTPDGSGITMWFVAGPMMLLYIVGMFTIERKTPNLV